MRLREELDTDSKEAERTGATLHETVFNRFEVPCGVCGRLYFVDETVARRVEEAQSYDPSEIGFYCDNCEAEYYDGEHEP